MDELIESAPEWVAPIGDADAKTEATRQEDELIEALARMRPGVEFDRERKRAAKQLGVRRGAIDDEIGARRSRREETTAPLYGHWAVDPWPEIADGDALLRDIVQRVRRHVICSQKDALAIALWIMFAWVHDEVAAHSPILNITSAEPESGKSTVLGLISFLTPQCLPSVEITEAALFRAIKLWSPCFVIDEFDNVLASDDNAALRSVINSGHTRGQGVVRCVEPGFRPEHFMTFCPKAIGMVGRKLPATTLSRCIVVEMRRRRSDERVDKFDHKDDAVLAALRSRLLRWSTDNAEALRLAEPSMPPAFGNRRADNWRVLFAIADLAGDDWGEKARLAAMQLESANDTTTIGVRLLADIKQIFDEDSGSCMLSATLVEKLVKDEEGPWAAWNNGKGLTQNSLAVLLGGGGGRGRRSRGDSASTPTRFTRPAVRRAKGTSEPSSRMRGLGTCRLKFLLLSPKGAIRPYKRTNRCRSSANVKNRPYPKAGAYDLLEPSYLTAMRVCTFVRSIKVGGTKSKKIEEMRSMDTHKDPRRHGVIEVRPGGNSYRLTIGGELWSEVEWSASRRAWCIQDAAGRCLTHVEHIHAQHVDAETAIRLAKKMIRDGRMPTPEEAEAALRSRTVPQPESMSRSV